MEQKLAVERLYSLGDYKNIKFTSEITSIPAEVMLNKDAIALVRYLQLVDIEHSYMKYQQLMRKAIPSKPVEEAMEEALAFLDTERSETFDHLISAISK